MKKYYYAIVISLVLSPIPIGLINEAIRPSVGEIDGLGTGILMILGVPFVGIVGLLVSGAVSIFKVKNKNWSLAGYISSALLTSYLILK